MADRFYLNCPLAAGTVAVTGPEAHHLAVVCRARPGDRVCLFNGDGHEYPAEVVAAERRGVILNVLGVETPARELGFCLEIAAPLPKGDRGQFLVEKLTELGATRFTPLRTRRSVRHPGDARHDKLERYVIEASKQCGRNALMQIGPLTDWESFCERADLPPVRWLAQFGGGPPAAATGQDVVGAVGPEGGLTEEEVSYAMARGWRPVGLGRRVLRVETAALVLAVTAVSASAV
jgi:16S rRNA (uracil1498-N3)-methyltransferase